jgi:hypothetical protein
MFGFELELGSLCLSFLPFVVVDVLAADVEVAVVAIKVVVGNNIVVKAATSVKLAWLDR